MLSPAPLGSLIWIAAWTLQAAPAVISWPYLAGRVFIASAVAILATYAGGRASGHRREEQHLRRTELEMASIDPYLALLPEADRTEIKKSVAGRMFAQPERSTEPEGRGPSGSVVDLAKSALDTAKEGSRPSESRRSR